MLRDPCWLGLECSSEEVGFLVGSGKETEIGLLLNLVLILIGELGGFQMDTAQFQLLGSVCGWLVDPLKMLGNN